MPFICYEWYLHIIKAGAQWFKNQAPAYGGQ